MQLPSAANAQDLESSYFMEGSTYRHRMNPAFINESNYINLPFIGIGNMNINVSSDFGMSNFLYPAANGSLTTFMNPSVSSEQFLSGLNTKNRLGLSLSTDILSVGFYGIAGGYSTIELGIKSDTWLNLPYNVFALLKNGMYDAEGTSYDLNGISATSNNYVQLSFGHSRYVFDDVLSVGAKVKVLFGIANATATIDGNAYLSQDKWQIDASGSITGSLQGARFTTDAGGIVNGLAIDKYGIAGYGAALDLGAYFDMKDFVEGLAISASVTDLGFISWNNSITAQMEHGFIFEGFENPIGEGSSLNDEINALGQDLKEFIKFRPGEDIKSRTSMLSAKMFIGVEYKLPMYDKVKFGLLSSTTFNNPFTYTEARLVAQYSPADWFEFNINYAYGTFGSSFGWMLNFHPKGFNFFIGSDNTYFGKFSPQFIPTGKLNTSIHFGFNVKWGERR